MNKITFATLVSSALAALAIGLAGPRPGRRRSWLGRAAARRPHCRLPADRPHQWTESVHALPCRPVRAVWRVGPALSHIQLRGDAPSGLGQPWSGGMT